MVPTVRVYIPHLAAAGWVRGVPPLSLDPEREDEDPSCGRGNRAMLVVPPAVPFPEPSWRGASLTPLEKFEIGI